MVHVTTQRRFLTAAATGTFAVAAATVVWSLTDIPRDAAVLSQVSRDANEIAPVAAPSTVADLSSVTNRILRRALVDPVPKPAPPDPAPTVAVVPRPSTPKLNVVLVGTIIQPPQSLAIVADASGSFDVKGIGQSLELMPAGIVVASIESERVTLRYQGRESTLVLKPNATDQPAAPAGRAGGAGARRRNNR